MTHRIGRRALIAAGLAAPALARSATGPPPSRASSLRSAR